MHYEDDLHLLENLGKGRKVRNSMVAYKGNHRKYEYYKKSIVKEKFPPQSVNDMLRIATSKTQAIFKISSFGKGEQKVAAHMRYISRCGKLELEDQDGNKLKSLKEQRNCIKDWSVDFADNKRSRDTMNLVLSTPPGTNRDDALKAAKDFLESEYKTAGHDYIFVAHKDTEHPHVHAVIKMTSHYGKKLNPRKAYLRQVRSEYAKKCREYGIEVEASSRAERGLSGVSTRSEFVQMKKMNRRPKADVELINKIRKEREHSNVTPHLSEQKSLKRNQIIRKRYADKAQQLYSEGKTSTDKGEQNKYIKGAAILENFAKVMPIEKFRGEKVREQLDKKLGVTLSRAKINNVSTNEEKSLDQFYAVTAGLRDESGIYHSPAQLLSNQIKDNLSVQVSRQDKLEKNNSAEIEQEINFDD